MLRSLVLALACLATFAPAAARAEAVTAEQRPRPRHQVLVTSRLARQVKASPHIAAAAKPADATTGACIQYLKRDGTGKSRPAGHGS